MLNGCRKTNADRAVVVEMSGQSFQRFANGLRRGRFGGGDTYELTQQRPCGSFHQRRLDGRAANIDTENLHNGLLPMITEERMLA